MKRFLAIILISLLNFCLILADNPEWNIEVSSISANESTINCKLKIVVEKNWHPAKKPEIILESSENIQDFFYNSNGRCEEIGKQTWCVDFSFTKNNNLKNSTADLTVHCPLCSDICTIATKKIKMSDEELLLFSKNENEYNGNLKNLSPFSDLHSASTFSTYFLIILLFAFLGGCILNVMPCVLPVLLLKLKTFTYSGKNKKVALCGSILGNYFVFLIFAAAVLFLKKSGELVGWGMHFQNVVFLKTIAVVLFLLLLYSEELIVFSPSCEIKNESKLVLVSNFVSSIVASVMSLPCTAPFLGTAATFAIAEGTALQLFIVFMTIATGFSTPYWVAFIIPQNFSMQILGSTKILYWFGRIFKKLVSLGIFIALAWIIFLISKNYDNIIGAVIFCNFVLAFICFRSNFKKFAIVFLLSIFFISPNRTYSETVNIEKVISSENVSKNIVVLNITADWCVTCQFNKTAVLNTKEIQKAFKKNHVIFIEANMNRKNDAYMKFIRKHNRVGIPFTIVFGPSAPEGLLLSETFSKQELLQAIKKASGIKN